MTVRGNGAPFGRRRETRVSGPDRAAAENGAVVQAQKACGMSFGCAREACPCGARELPGAVRC